MSRKNPNPQARKAVQGKPAKEQAKAVDFALYERYAGYLFYALLLFVAIFVYRKYLFFENVYLFKDIGSDTINGLYPPIKHLAGYMRSESIVPGWSFNYGMGQNMFPFFLRDPFDFILYCIGNPGLVYGIGYIEFAKVVLAGIFFFQYLKTLKMSAYTSALGGLLYAFSGFMIVGSGWYVFSAEVMLTAFLLFATEKLLLERKWYWFPLAIALLAGSMPFNLYLYGLFLFIYITFRFLDEYEWDLKEYAQLLLKLAGFGVLGIAISAVLFFPNLLQLIESPRVGGGVSYAQSLSKGALFALQDPQQRMTMLMRMFSSDLMGTGNNFKGWMNYLEAPELYCGVISLLLFPQVFAFLGRKKRIIYAVFLAIWILPLIFPYMRQAFWLFTGDYYRGFSFFVTFCILYLALRSFDLIIRNGRISIPLLITSVVVLFMILLSPDKKLVNASLLNTIRFLLLLYAVLIYLLSVESVRVYVYGFLLLAVCIELGNFSYTTLNKRSVISAEELTQKIGYNDYTVDAMDYLHKVDKSFFRINKTYWSGQAIHRSINDGLVQDFYGTSAYNSFNQLNYVKFLQEQAVIPRNDEFATRWAPGLESRPLLQTFVSVKYTLNKDASKRYLHEVNDSITRIGDVTIFRNRYYLPLGITYDRITPRTVYDAFNPLQKDITMVRSCVAENEDTLALGSLARYAAKDTNKVYAWEDHYRDILSRRTDTLAIQSFKANRIQGKINLASQKMLFFSIPMDRGWKALVDGKEAKIYKVDVGFMGLLLSKGTHDVVLEFEPPFVKSGFLVSLISLIGYAGAVFVFSRRSKKALSA